MVRNRQMPEVNAGSMADIAFLLLIFFLVTTSIESDVGLGRKLPTDTKAAVIQERNVLRVSLNSSNQLLVENEIVPIRELRDIAIAFLDNGGATAGMETCGYCQGDRDSFSSVNPQKAVISVATTRATNYGTFIAVQNELVGAYNELRDREGLRLYQVTYQDLMDKFENAGTPQIEKMRLKHNIEELRSMFPKIISEAVLN